MDWVAMSEPWLKAEAGIEAAHQPVLDGLLARAGLAPGQHVLDIGCGMGASLLAAVGQVLPGGRITGVDIAPPMVERAAERVPDAVSVIAADAGTHEFGPHSFDAAISLFGTMFFDDTEAAFARIRRAMRPGALLTLAAWGPPPRNPWFGIGRGAVEGRFGPQPRPDPAAPGPFRFADPSGVMGALAASGWEVEVETEELHLTPMGGAAEVAAFQMVIGSAPMMLSDLDPTEEDLRAVEAALAEGFAAHERDGAVRVPAAIHYVRARA